MSITETPIAPLPRKTKPKKRRVAKRAAPKVKADATVEYPGLTVTDCAKACSASGCVISGSTYCAHPRKGGLQGGDMGKADAVQRMQKAQKSLAMIDATKRFS